MLHPLHVIASLDSKHGGPPRSITGLCDAISKIGPNVVLVSQKLSTENVDELIVPSNPRVKIIFINALKRFGRVYTSNYDKQFSEILSQEHCQLVHSHGIWLQCNRQSAECSKQFNIPHIISPRGMLEPWALSHNSWKKKPVWFLWQKRALKLATAFCATSDQEAVSIRSLGFSQPIAVIPNGVHFYDYVGKQLIPNNNDRIALFLSRLHPKKGLSNLVKAWACTRPSGWKVVIAGPNENGHKSEIQSEIVSLGLDGVFEFIEPVDGIEKERLYRDASIFILPTFSENFGIVVVEALAAGTPVITTKGTPWEGLVTHNCGWWVDIGVEPLSDAIREATSMSDSERIAMGLLGREYVEREFGWDEIGRKMVLFYDWILNGGSPPDFVRLD